MRLFILLVLIVTGVVLGFVIQFLMALMGGIGIETMMNQSKMMESPTWFIRGLLFINHLTMFILPGIAWALIYYKKDWISKLSFNFKIHWKYILAGILFLLAAYPMVSKSYELNKMIPLPEWAGLMEEATAEVLKKILAMNSITALVINVFLIGIIPGIGEELIFRGIIQTEISKHFKSPMVAILLSAIIFSAFHLQFEGFLPRFLLGVVLSLLFYWTGSLWVSMVVHAFNNGIQVIASYFYPQMVEQDLEQAVPVNFLALLASVLITAALGYWFYNEKKRSGSPESPTIS